MTVGKKLMLGYGGMLLMAVVLAVAALYSVGSLGAELDQAINVTGKKVALIQEIQSNLFKMRACQRGVMLFAMQSLPEKMQSNKQEFESRAAAIPPILQELKPLLVTETARNAVSSVETEVPSLKDYFEQIAAAASAGRSQEARSIDDEHAHNLWEALEKNTGDLVKAQKQLMEEASTRGAQRVSTARWTAIILVAIILGLTPVLLVIIRRSTKQLQGIAVDLGEGAQQMASASGQVASSSQALAQGASEQAASLEETSSSSEEITSMTRKNAENSQVAATVMSEVDQHIQAGNRTLEQMVVSMKEITASSDKISKIIKVIDEIAFQTNILALNAAVEAARAGEAGMGFAVVADEVRNLAQRSAQAAKDTAALIEESIAKSSEGGTKVEQVNQVIRAITESASKVKALVDEVNLGSQEQARGIEQISKSLAQMDQVTQSTAANAEESASASEEMSAQAEALNHAVAALRLLVGGEGGQMQEAPSQHRARPASKISTFGTATHSTGNIRRLKSAVSRAVKPAQARNAVPEIPLEDNFVEM